MYTRTKESQLPPLNRLRYRLPAATLLLLGQRVCPPRVPLRLRDAARDRRRRRAADPQRARRVLRAADCRRGVARRRARLERGDRRRLQRRHAYGAAARAPAPAGAA